MKRILIPALSLALLSATGCVSFDLYTSQRQIEPVVVPEPVQVAESPTAQALAKLTPWEVLKDLIGMLGDVIPISWGATERTAIEEKANLWKKTSLFRLRIRHDRPSEKRKTEASVASPLTAPTTDSERQTRPKFTFRQVKGDLFEVAPIENIEEGSGGWETP